MKANKKHSQINTDGQDFQCSSLLELSVRPLDEIYGTHTPVSDTLDQTPDADQRVLS